MCLRVNIPTPNVLLFSLWSVSQSTFFNLVYIVNWAGKSSKHADAGQILGVAPF